MAAPNIDRLLVDEMARSKPPRRLPPIASLERDFKAIDEDRYHLAIAEIGITFEIDRLRRERHELVGELCVRCDLPGARTVDGALSIADLNISSARARQERAKLLTQRANTRDLDWSGLLEEFAQKVLQADRIGQPAVDLRMMPAPAPDDAIEVDGVYLARRHPNMGFGDGGALKSLYALWLLGRLVERGLRVALFDWELAGEDHRARLDKLFPDGMPRILYARCERPLVHEVDRLRRIVKDNEIEFAVYDSVAFACDGPPEAAEVAGRYFRAVRQVCPGSFHIAHTSKGENADKRPFGSNFWWNGARSIWYFKSDQQCTEGDLLHLGLFHRKANLGKLRPPVGFRVSFEDHHISFTRSNVADSPDLARTLSVRQRMYHLLRRGAMTPEAIAEEIEADLETVKRTARRYKNQFTVIDGGRFGLLDRSAS